MTKLAPILALLLTVPMGALAAPAPDPCADYGADACGVVPAGSGAALAANVDHRRHAVPEGAVGIVRVGVIINEGPLPIREPLFARLERCPPGLACTQDGGDEYVGRCLAAYAPAGAVATPYAFRWAYSEAEADLLFSEMPAQWMVPPLPGPSPTSGCL